MTVGAEAVVVEASVGAVVVAVFVRATGREAAVAEGLRWDKLIEEVLQMVAVHLQLHALANSWSGLHKSKNHQERVELLSKLGTFPGVVTTDQFP